MSEGEGVTAGADFRRRGRLPESGRPVPADLVNVLPIMGGFTFGERVGVARQAG